MPKGVLSWSRELCITVFGVVQGGFRLTADLHWLRGFCSELLGGLHRVLPFESESDIRIAMSLHNKATVFQAVLGAVLITVLMVPFQAVTPYAPYTALLILPVLFFFTLGAPPQALPAIFASFAAGVGWAALFMLVKDALPGVPFEAMMGIGIAVVIFLILSLHPTVLSKTPLGIVPAVLLGLTEALLVMLLMPMLADGEPKINLLWVLAIFAYGCVMTFVLVVTQDKLTKKLFGEEWAAEAAGKEVQHAS